MTFLNPLYLWGLLGLVVPLAIHLWSKKEGKTIKIGSIKFLTEANPKQASSIQLNELLLLFLRFLLLALLVLILAEPQWNRQAENQTVAYLIEPALFKNPEIRSMIDSLPEGTVRLLKVDFPKWERDQVFQNSEKTPNYWQLAQGMKNLRADSIVIFTSALLQGIYGKRPAINTNINWVTLNPETVRNQMILAEKEGDSIKLVSINSNSNILTFDTEKISQNSLEISQKNDSILLQQNGKPFKLPLIIQDTLRIQISASDSLSAEKKYIDASFRALGFYMGQPLKLTEAGDSVNSETDVLVWLKNEQIPDISGRILTYKPDILAKKLITPTANRNVFNLTQHLNSENIISGNLPEQLLTLLDLHPHLEGEITKYDLRSLSKNELQTRRTDSRNLKNYSNSVDLSSWFWLAFILLLIAERLTAFFRKQ